MNNLGKSLLVASFAIGAANATGSTNKTFFSGRPVGVNLAMEGTTWHNQINTPTDVEDKFDGSLQVTGFYQENTNQNELGRYFSFQNKDNIAVGEAATGIDADHRYFFHNNTANSAADIIGSSVNSGTAKFTGTINLDYIQESAGVRFDYQHDFDNLYEGVYLKVRAPLVWQKSGVRLNLTNSVTATVNLIGSSGVSDTTTVSLSDYFSGNLTRTAGFPVSEHDYAQDALKYAKIDGPQDSIGLADVDVLLGWNFKETESSHAGGYVGFTIPTSPAPDGRFLGQSGYGNNGHWAVGAGVNSKVRLWEEEESNLDLHFALDWKYLLKDIEVRTLGLRDFDWSQYVLVGNAVTNVLRPLANILTQQVLVRPGNMVDMALGFAYTSGNFVADFGYNMYAKESEIVNKNCPFFKDGDQFAIPESDFNDPSFANGGADAQPFFYNINTKATNKSSPGMLNDSDVVVEPARTPSQVTHKVYGGLGYAFNEWEQPFMLGVGASYEGASSSVGLDSWAVWAKLGLTF